MDDTTRAELFRGAIVGTAVGDALGAPFEGRRHPPPSAIHAWAESSEPLRWTDDTHLTIGVAASLGSIGDLDCDDMAARFASNYEAEPWRGYGAGPPRVFAALRSGEGWRRAARHLYDGRGSFGNGAAMRSVPFGLYAWRDPRRAAALAYDAAAITHAHVLGRQGAAAIAYACARMVTASGSGQEARDVPGVMTELGDVADAPEFRARFEIAAQLGPGTAPVVAARKLGNGIAAVDSVPAAIHAAVHHRGSFAEAVLHAVAIGGDTDTIAAMTGGLSGALHGLSAIPRSWVERAERIDELVDLADRLGAVS